MLFVDAKNVMLVCFLDVAFCFVSFIIYRVSCCVVDVVLLMLCVVAACNV